MANIPNNRVDHNWRGYQRTIAVRKNADGTMSKIYSLRRFSPSVRHEGGASLVRNEAPDTFHPPNSSNPVNYHESQTARKAHEKIRHKHKPSCEERSKFRTTLLLNPRRTRTRNRAGADRNCNFENELFEYWGPRFAAVERCETPAPLEPFPNYSDPMNYPATPTGPPQYCKDALKYERYGHKWHDWLRRQAEQAGAEPLSPEVMDPVAPAYQITDLHAALDSPCSPPETNPNFMAYLANLGSYAPRGGASYDDCYVNDGYNQPSIAADNNFDCDNDPDFILPEDCQHVSNILPFPATPEYSPQALTTCSAPTYASFTRGLTRPLIQSGPTINPTTSPCPRFNQSQPCSHTISAQSGPADPCSILPNESTQYDAFKNDLMFGGSCPPVKNLTMGNLNDISINSNCPHHQPFSEPTCSHNLNESPQAPCRRGQEFYQNLQSPGDSCDDGIRTQFTGRPFSNNLQSHNGTFMTIPTPPLNITLTPDQTIGNICPPCDTLQGLNLQSPYPGISERTIESICPQCNKCPGQNLSTTLPNLPVTPGCTTGSVGPTPGSHKGLNLSATLPNMSLQSSMRADSTPQGPVTVPPGPDGECKTPDLANETVAATIAVALKGLDDITKTLKRKNPLKCLKDMQSLSDREKFNRLLKENIAQVESNFILIRDKVKKTLCDISRILIRQTALQLPELKPLFEDIEKKCDRSGDLEGATDEDAYATLITSTVRGFEKMTSALKLAPKTKALDEIVADSDTMNELLNHMADETDQSFTQLQSATKDILKQFKRISADRSDLIKSPLILDLIKSLEEEEEHSCGIRNSNIKNKAVGKTIDKTLDKTLDKSDDDDDSEEGSSSLSEAGEDIADELERTIREGKDLLKDLGDD